MRHMDVRLTADRVVLQRAHALENCHLGLLELLARLPSLVEDTGAGERVLTLHVREADLHGDSGFCLDPEHLRGLADSGCSLNVVFGIDQ